MVLTTCQRITHYATPGSDIRHCCRVSAAMKGVKHLISRLNPKAVKDHQIFGFMDPTTSDWTEGGVPRAVCRPETFSDQCPVLTHKFSVIP
eukprot:1538516-Rhodomonas_salina.3